MMFDLLSQSKYFPCWLVYITVAEPVWVRACVRVCVRAGVCVCMHVCVHVCVYLCTPTY